MDQQQLLIVLRGVVNAIFGENTVAVCNASDRSPAYETRSRGCDICQLAKREKSIGKKCVAFYSEKKQGKHKCPYGITVDTTLYEIGSGTKVAVHLQTEIDCEQLSNVVSELPRREKKMASKISGNCRAFKKEPSQDLRELLDNSVKSLLLARISVAIQAVSHDLLTPVHGAVSDVEMLKRHVNSVEAEGVFQRLQDNLIAVASHAKRIGMLLTPEHWFSLNRYRDVTVHAFLKQIAARLSSVANDKEVEIQVGFNQHRVRVPAIPDLFELVLTALLENAVKYAYSKTTVNVDFESEAGFLVIVFKNYGVPIEQDEIDNRLIFQLGYRGRNSTDRQRIGTGSGLYIANQIVDGHEGKIAVQSIPQGSGAVVLFKLYWPIYKPE